MVTTYLGLEVSMLSKFCRVDGLSCEINRGARKLVWTLALYIKKTQTKRFPRRLEPRSLFYFLSNKLLYFHK